ncbi:hypothetical protein [uncultured Desulfosarcina sp.]|uniref:hypothetical protein n=1 Tax=uncultured Desulfosarcina sp. TaxID=218289 RepID=UPI0029C8A4F5|nr:hypothetical protein [uncultured Desulfosarcina sp.]
MWDNSADASIKIANMKGYSEGLYFVLLTASEGEDSNFATEKKLYGEFAALLLPLNLALKRYDEEEFPVPERADDKQ